MGRMGDPSTPTQIDLLQCLSLAHLEHLTSYGFRTSTAYSGTKDPLNIDLCMAGHTVPESKNYLNAPRYGGTGGIGIYCGHVFCFPSKLFTLVTFTQFLVSRS